MDRYREIIVKRKANRNSDSILSITTSLTSTNTYVPICTYFNAGRSRMLFSCLYWLLNTFQNKGIRKYKIGTSHVNRLKGGKVCQGELCIHMKSSTPQIKLR